MEDSKKISSSSSSPNLISSGNNENESENHRNLQQKTKNFMAPTFSTASKIISPKKRILAEWKPPLLESKSEIQKMGIPNTHSRNSSPKSPKFSFPAFHVKNSDEILKKDETFVPDSCSKPYDPLTNYLSPRPKFLRYNPNRKRKLFLEKSSKMGCISPSVSECESSSSAENSLVNEEVGGVKQFDEQTVVEDDEEELIEERNWGFKWELFKGLVVFFAWLFCSVFIASVNSPATYQSSVSEIKIGYENFDNITVKVVSLLNVQSMNWVDAFGNDKIEPTDRIVPSSKENQVSDEDEKLGFDLDSEDDYAEEDTVSLDEANLKVHMNADYYQMDSFKDDVEEIPDYVERVNENGEVEILISGNKSENGVKEIVAPMIAPDHIAVNKEEQLVQFEEKRSDFVPKANEDLGVEAGIDAQGSSNDIEQKNKDDLVKETADFESEFKVVPSQNVAEVDVDNNQEGTLVGFEERMNDVVPRPNDGGLENEEVVVAEGSSNSIEQKIKVEYESKMTDSEPEFKDVKFADSDDKQVRLNKREFRVLVPIIVMIWVGLLVVACWRKCKKTFLRTNSSRRRINPQAERNQNNRNAGLPLTVEERHDHVHHMPDSQVTTKLSSVVVGEGTSRRIPGARQLGELDFTGESSGSFKSTGLRSGSMPPIPRAKQLGELDFTREFSGSFKSIGMRSSKMQEQESVFAVPDDRKAKKSKGSCSTPPPPESPSYSSKFLSTLQVDGSGEVSAVRRSERIRNRGVTPCAA